MLLSIDTSAGTSAAVLGESVNSFVSFEDPFGHAENIGKAIAEALAQAKVSPRELTSVAVGRGPAPYTGLRVGMAAASSFAKALGIPLHGVITLDAIAHSCGDGSFLVVTDAKRRELFAATYVDGRRNSGPVLISPADLSSFPGYEIVQHSCDARKVGSFALSALQAGQDLGDVTALYLRSPDVTPSAGKRVSG